MSEYYQARASKAGKTRSPAKTLAARRASMLTPQHLSVVAREHPEMTDEIAGYLMAGDQEKALTRMALVEKLEKLAKDLTPN